jgi:hypothetical protein
VANIKTGSRSFEIEPNPSCGVNRPTVLSEHSTSTVIGASRPNLARSECWRERRSVPINVLVEPKNGVYELGRHKRHNRFCLAALGRMVSDRVPRPYQIAV